MKRVFLVRTGSRFADVSSNIRDVE